MGIKGKGECVIAALCVCMMMALCSCSTTSKDMGVPSTGDGVSNYHKDDVVIDLPSLDIVLHDVALTCKSPLNLVEGSIVGLGSYFGKTQQWIVAKLDGSRALLVSRFLVECPVVDMMYNSTSLCSSWKDSSVRKWLEEVFYSSLGDDAAQLILESATEEDCIDHVFLLSDEEFESSALHPYWAIGSLVEEGASCPWWLRTLSNEGAKAMFVGEDGCIDENGMAVNYTYGIRPAVWVDASGLLDQEVL